MKDSQINNTIKDKLQLFPIQNIRILFWLCMLISLSYSPAQAQWKIKKYYDTLDGSRLKELLIFKSKKEKILHGHYEKYYVTGFPQMKGRFNMGQKDSVFTEFYPNGNMKLQMTYVKGVKQGPFHIYKDNQFLHQRGCYLQDSIIDTLYTYHEQGILKAKSCFVKDKIEGMMYLYDKSGVLKQKAEYRLNKPDGLTQVFYEDGKTINSEEHFSMGQLDGPFAYYYKNGKKKEEGNHTQGQRQGAYKTYYDKGQVSFEAQYQKGSMQGKAKSYYLNGATKGVYEYFQGKAEGAYTLFDSLGKIEEEVATDMKASTIRKKKYLKGQLWRQEFYEKDNHEGLVKAGKWSVLYLSGKDSLVEYYENGKKNKESVVYSANGKLQSTTPYFQGMKQGVAKSWDESGNLVSEITYKRDDMSGLSKYYDKNKLQKEGMLQMGLKTGWWTVYDVTGQKPLTQELYKQDKLVQSQKYKALANTPAKTNKLPLKKQPVLKQGKDAHPYQKAPSKKYENLHKVPKK